MNRQTSRIAAITLALALSGAAQAVPILFEFSGVAETSEADWNGELATGRFLIETDNFSVLPTPPPTVTWTDVLPFDARPDAIGASFSIGDDFISLNDAVETYGGIHFTGSCGACFPGWSEVWAISGNTQSFPLGGQPGSEYTMSSLTFNSRGPIETDFIPDSGLTPIDILALPLGEVTGAYTSWLTTCAAESGECLTTNYVSVRFQVTSLTRTLVSTPVPEPGTLGLLGAALLGVVVRRRSRPDRLTT
jgi:hypothetical protein